MATVVYFENVKTGKRFKVLNLDKEKGIVTLQGETAKFEHPYSREIIEGLGYKLVRAEEPDAVKP